MPKVRRNLFEPVEITLDHPGAVMSKAAGPAVPGKPGGGGRRRGNAGQIRRLTSVDPVRRYPGGARRRGARCPVDRCITTKYRGAITLAGVRGVAVADVIRGIGAKSQLAPAVFALVLSKRVPLAG